MYRNVPSPTKVLDCLTSWSKSCLVPNMRILDPDWFLLSCRRNGPLPLRYLLAIGSISRVSIVFPLMICRCLALALEIQLLRALSDIWRLAVPSIPVIVPRRICFGFINADASCLALWTISSFCFFSGSVGWGKVCRRSGYFFIVPLMVITFVVHLGPLFRWAHLQ